MFDVKTKSLPNETELTPALARVFKRLHYPFDVMLMCVRWYVAYAGGPTGARTLFMTG
jgi:hypothetical protein